MATCPICEHEAQSITTLEERDRGIESFHCQICGVFAATFEAQAELTTLDGRWAKARPKLSSYTKERTLHGRAQITITSAPDVQVAATTPYLSIAEIASRFPILMSERYNRALKNLVKLSTFPGKRIELNLLQDYPIFFSDIIGDDVAKLILSQLALDGYIVEPTSYFDQSCQEIQVTLKGWHRVEELERINPESKQGFIAMWFDQEMDEAAVHGFEQAVEDAGYSPLRLDRKEHNEKIDDQIVAEIRASKFVIADFTGNSNGVYFEAGLAMGLGLPVIWTVREDYSEQIHFDTRQYNHIIWDSPEDLKNKLYYRIRATIV